MKRIALPISKSKTQFFVNQTYVEYLIKAGYEPVLVFNAENCKELDKHCIKMAETCDGLLLPGGIDIDPIFYREDNIMSYKTDPEKDEFERMLFYAFIDHGKPVFGICRGFQLMCREYIRTNGQGIATRTKDTYIEFYQNITGHNDPTKFDVPRTQPTHYVEAKLSSLYIEGEDEGRIAINSIHHQALAITGPKNMNPWNVKMVGDIVIAAWKEHESLKSGVVVEAIDFNGFFKGSKVIGVQWHPEELNDYALLHNVFGFEEAKAVDEPKNTDVKASDGSAV